MSKIKPVTAERKDIFLYKTRVENLFINEFLPEAPGDYVKVYLFGLMYAQYDQVIDSAKLSMILGLSEEEIEEAWIYWESKGLVKFRTDISETGEPDRKLVFTRQIEVLYGKASAEPVEELPEEKEAEPVEESISDEIPHFMNMDDMEFDTMFEKKMQALGPYRYKILPLEDTIHFCNSNHLFIPGIEMFNQDFVVDLKQALDQTEAR